MVNIIFIVIVVLVFFVAIGIIGYVFLMETGLLSNKVKRDKHGVVATRKRYRPKILDTAESETPFDIVGWDRLKAGHYKLRLKQIGMESTIVKDYKLSKWQVYSIQDIIEARKPIVLVPKRTDNAKILDLENQKLELENEVSTLRSDLHNLRDSQTELLDSHTRFAKEAFRNVKEQKNT